MGVCSQDRREGPAGLTCAGRLVSTRWVEVGGHSCLRLCDFTGGEISTLVAPSTASRSHPALFLERATSTQAGADAS